MILWHNSVEDYNFNYERFHFYSTISKSSSNLTIYLPINAKLLLISSTGDFLNRWIVKFFWMHLPPWIITLTYFYFWGKSLYLKFSNSTVKRIQKHLSKLFIGGRKKSLPEKCLPEPFMKITYTCRDNIFKYSETVQVALIKCF